MDRWSAWILVPVLLAGCDTRTVTLTDAAPDVARDGGALAEASLPDRSIPDGATPRDVPVPRDAAVPDADACYCPAGQVWLRGSCVPTEELGCGPTCDPAVPGSCPAGRTCDPWAAAPCCICSAAVPACVPAASTGPISGPLRHYPTSGGAGQSVTITVEGAPFYIGALFYKLRLGSEEQMDMSGGKCSVKASFTPPAPGLYPVEVSQYGGGAPWVLAGFFTASGGVPPGSEIQPGYPCSAGGLACLQAAPYTCACVAGRCQCTKP